MSVLAAKLIQLIYGDFYCSQQDKDKQKRPPRQEGVFSIAGKFGRLSPQGGDLVQNGTGRSGLHEPGLHWLRLDYSI